MRRVMLIALALVASLGITASTATTASTEAGVTATSIKIGGTFPLSGPASLYATIPVAMKAYFSYINARRGPDGKRGVYGRQIIWNYKDDQYSPPNAVQLTRGLVEQDNVFAVVGSLGTEVNLAIRPYLNSKKVPQMLVCDRRDDVGRGLEAVPLDDRLAARLPARGQVLRRRRSPVTARTPRSASSTRTTTTARTTSRASRPVSAPRRRTSSTRSRSRSPRRASPRRSRSCKASGATIFVILATPTKTIQSYATANALKWSPDSDLHELRLGHRHVPHAREGERRRRPRQPDVHDAVREGPGEPEVGQRRRHEALQADHGEVLPQGPRHGRASISTGSASPRPSSSSSTAPARTRRAPR